eukprot:TRINITY_DN6118_c1_g2_i1.p1 TRINITY_DN6118_c1_g2~~TRINITY_DN6118_c1_g2_i1.p1  ORF type:complete len:107 (-),score=5.81 TRINITY_DN6118_c1_g2_i1:88-408(-)
MVKVHPPTSVNLTERMSVAQCIITFPPFFLEAKKVVGSCLPFLNKYALEEGFLLHSFFFLKNGGKGHEGGGKKGKRKKKKKKTSSSTIIAEGEKKKKERGGQKQLT